VFSNTLGQAYWKELLVSTPVLLYQNISLTFATIIIIVSWATEAPLRLYVSLRLALCIARITWPFRPSQETNVGKNTKGALKRGPLYVVVLTELPASISKSSISLYPSFEAYIKAVQPRAFSIFTSAPASTSTSTMSL